MAKSNNSAASAPPPGPQVVRTFKCSTPYVPDAEIQVADDGYTYEEIIDAVAASYAELMGINHTPYPIEVQEIHDHPLPS